VAPGVVGVIVVVAIRGAYRCVSSSSLELSDWGPGMLGSSSKDLESCSLSDGRLSPSNSCISSRSTPR
jgi:hypothetical protein